MIILCSYCYKQAELVDSDKGYGMIWLCRPCDAYVGTHKKDNSPLGTLAKYELREWRIYAHAVFDLLWKKESKWKDKSKQKYRRKQKARKRAYHWLANELGILVEDCHIAMFDIEMCKRVVIICQSMGGAYL